MKSIIFSVMLGLSMNANAGYPETLLGYFFDDHGVTIQVNTGGCTSRGDFYIVKQMKNPVRAITFYREFHDSCLALARYGVLFTYSYEELGLVKGARFKILNKIDASYRGY